jgi:hypothetical protein
MFALIKERILAKFPTQVCDQEKKPTSLKLELQGKVEQTLMVKLERLTIATSEA